MNCKQGDLAIMQRGPLAGNLVTCLRYVGVPPVGKAAYSDCWEIDRKVYWFSGYVASRLYPYYPDSYLRPIRDSDKTDEIIERIGKPVKETT